VSTSKNHHWWPICVSEFWKDADGLTTRLSPNGEKLRLAPKKFGFIGHGHTTKMSRVPGETTVWDYNFENEFQRADQNFPQVIRWLEGLKREDQPSPRPLMKRFLPQDVPEDRLSLLMEGIVSLCVRSPMNRNAAIGAAKRFRGNDISVRERDAIITLNIRYQQRALADALGTHGKFAIIYSPKREFIFGDGFFHNLTSQNLPSHPEILVPLTPNMSVLFVRPSMYSTEPKLSTLVVNAEEADVLNHAVQIYSKEMIFYRSEEPSVMEEFRRAEHLRYAGPENSITNLIHGIPGVPPRDTSLDFLFKRAHQR
jgi:hypothetical protein